MLRAWARNRVPSTETGAMMIESAVVLPLVFLMVFVTIDLLRVGLNVLSVQFVAERVIRNASVGGMSGDQISEAVIGNASIFGVSITPENVTMCPLSSGTCTGVNPGGSGEMMVLSVRYPVRGLFFGSFYIGDGEGSMMQIPVLRRNETW